MESDSVEAFKWFVMVAEQGLAMAQANAGEYYEFSKGVLKIWNKLLYGIKKRQS